MNEPKAPDGAISVLTLRYLRLLLFKAVSTGQAALANFSVPGAALLHGTKGNEGNEVTSVLVPGPSFGPSIGHET